MLSIDPSLPMAPFRPILGGGKPLAGAIALPEPSRGPSLLFRIGRGSEMVRATLVVLVLLASAAQAAEPALKKETEVDAARFQLFQGTYSTFDLRRSETYSSTAVFLLDTRTGRVKRYVNKIDTEGRYIEEWVPTDRSQERR
jgi:hypothetical protein